MGAFIDLTGSRFGRLLVIRRVGNGPQRQTVWLCSCDCGASTEVKAGHLRSGNTTSCGCWKQQILHESEHNPNLRHGALIGGGRFPTLYSAWCAMRARCLNANHKDYPNYGGRGITICERWQSFAAFAADMGDRPAGLTLDRIECDGNYEPSNCRWATRSEQCRNQRRWLARATS